MPKSTFLQLSDFQCGVTGNRTRDTRIFSPLLYQLSYDTRKISRTSRGFFPFGIAKIGNISFSANFFIKILYFYCILAKILLAGYMYQSYIRRICMKGKRHTFRSYCR